MQAPQWTDFLQCPICLQDFDDIVRLPVSLACGHTVCKSCLSNLQRRQCQFCSSPITTDIEKLPVNDALLLLSGGSLRHSPPLVESLNGEQRHYHDAKRAVESLALLLKPLSVLGTVGSTNNGTLSRPMQRKLVTLINCQLVEAEGRARAMRAARSLGERTVTELLLHHQNQQQLSSNLWAAVRQRGCQFLGPALQEECLRLILFSLEGGVQLSRKVLVKFVVSRLQEKEYHQASKTSVGHVVQLLYRASCFKVTKRDDESSLMELKEEFQSYEALRREHDSQIVQIAMEAGLRIAPDQWSSLLYGDTNHKSHMQSIIDKLQTPESFSHSIDELVIALTRSGDPFNLGELREHFEFLSNSNASSDWETCSKGMQAVEAVVQGLVRFVQANQKSKSGEFQQAYNSKYKTSMCKDMQTRGSCSRGATCSFAHSEDEMERFRRTLRTRGRPMPMRVSGQPLQPPPLANMQPSLGHFSQSAGMSIPPPQSQFPPTFPGPHGPPSVHHLSNYIPYAQSPQPVASQPVLQSLTPKQSLSRQYPQEMMTGMAVPPSGPYSTPGGRMGVHSYGPQHPGSNKSYNSMPQLGNQYVRDGYPTSSQFGGRPIDFHPNTHGSIEGLYSEAKHNSAMYRDQMTPRAPILVNRGPHSGGSGPPSFGHYPTEYSYYGRRPPGPSFTSMSSGSFEAMPYGSGLSSTMSYGSDAEFAEYGSHQSFGDAHIGKANMQAHHEDVAYRPPPYSHQVQNVSQNSAVRPMKPPQWGSSESYQPHETSSSDQFGYGDMSYGAVNHQQSYGQQHNDIQVESQSTTSYRAFTSKEASKPPSSEYKSKWSVNSGINHGSGSASPESEYVASYRSKQRQSVTMQPPEKESTSEQKLSTDPFTMPSSPASAYSFSPVVGTPTNMKSSNVREREVQSPSTPEGNGSLFTDEKVRRKSPLASMWDDGSSSVSCLHKSPWSNDTEPTTSTGDSQWQPSVASAWFTVGAKVESKGTTGGSELDRKREELKYMEEELKKREAMIREKESALAEQQRKISSPKPDTSTDLELVRNIQRQLNAEELMEQQNAGSQISDEQLAWDIQRLEIGGDDVSLPCAISNSPSRKKSSNVVYNSSPVKDKVECESPWNDNGTNESINSSYDVAQKDVTDLVLRTPARGSNIQ